MGPHSKGSKILKDCKNDGVRVVGCSSNDPTSLDIDLNSYS